jgi:bifunctional enzyme CysN/CysC
MAYQGSGALTRDLLKIVIVGHVDHGKSTFVGRLFHDTGSLPPGKVDAIRAMCERRGMPFEWAFLMDAMQAERDQGITIDTAQKWFSTDVRDVTIIDAPGHLEFLKNMITGASQADAALLIVDAVDGVAEQTRRHATMLSMLGVREVAVLVNKMDAVSYDEARFKAVEADVRALLEGLNAKLRTIIPISAREGDNIVASSAATPWWAGSNVIETINAFPVLAAPNDADLRLVVQDVYKFDDRRIVAGRIESGRLNVGDELVFLPGEKTARVASIEVWPNDAARPEAASAGAAVGITLDRPVFIERGMVGARLDTAPAVVDCIDARIFWLGRAPLKVGASYRLRIGTLESIAVVTRVGGVVDTAALSDTGKEEIARNQAGEVRLRLRRPIAADDAAHLSATGRFVLIDGHLTVGGGVINLAEAENLRVRPKAQNLFASDRTVQRTDRERRNGHTGGVLWLTGLSGAGKSTVALALEQALFERGWNVFSLDGDDVRHGLNSDLGFSPNDRAENIRRVGEVAALFAQSGAVVVTSFISPYQADRDRARTSVRTGFHEVFVSTPIEECEARDPKGLYRKARAGEIPGFTGVSAPYEPPVSPEYVLDTTGRSIEECVAELIAYAERVFR